MQVAERQVFTIDEPLLIRNILGLFSARAKFEGSESSGICRRLEGLAKQGCEMLILNLRLLDESLEETAAASRNLRASLVGGVLVVTGQVTGSLIFEIEKLAHQHFFPTHLFSSLNAFVQSFF